RRVLLRSNSTARSNSPDRTSGSSTAPWAAVVGSTCTCAGWSPTTVIPARPRNGGDIDDDPVPVEVDPAGHGTDRARRGHGGRPVVGVRRSRRQNGDGLLQPRRRRVPGFGDRKSTRLNSSHVKISYAVFCLKKKK